MNEETRPIDSLRDIPADLSDEERMEFLEKHGVSEDFLDNVEDAPEDERPRPRTKPINIRFDDFTLARLKAMAGRRNVGYQTLLKNFVVERLYEEEKKEALLPTSEMASTQAPTQAAQERPTTKKRDWLDEVHEYIKENESLLEDPELDSITSSRLASTSASMLKEISGEIREASRNKGFPANKLRRLVKAYEKLKPFVERAIGLYEQRFGTPEEGAEGEGEAQTDPEPPRGSIAELRDELEAAEGIVIDARERFAM
jgi:hypothetical protein